MTQQTAAGASPPHTSSRFASLFAGYEAAYGAFRIERVADNGKVTGKATTVREAPTPDLYERHLQGTMGLGIIMLRSDDTVVFGAIDYDVRDVDLPALAQKVAALELPLVVCRSKSGGAHLYCFSSAPLPASVMRTRLAEFAAVLGLAVLPNGQRVEIFPKQSYRISETDIGSWINLPYWGVWRADGQPSPRHAFSAEGTPLLDIEDALHWMEVQRNRVTTERFRQSWFVGEKGESALFPDGPPCLQFLETQGGFPDGGKRNGMFDVAIYLQKRYGDQWKDHFPEYNNLANLRPEELVEIQRSVDRRGNYSYKCSDSPINVVCQKAECLRRRYGIGGKGGEETADVEFSGVTKYDPGNEFDEPWWALEVNGHRISVAHKEFLSKSEFNRVCLARINRVPVRVNADQWLRMVETLAQSAEIVPIPEGGTPTGQLLAVVAEFLTQQGRARERDEINLHKPYYDKDRVYFRPASLVRWLADRGRQPGEQKLWAILNGRGTMVESWDLGDGQQLEVWSMPSQQAQRLLEPLSLPAGEEVF